MGRSGNSFFSVLGFGANSFVDIGSTVVAARTPNLFAPIFEHHFLASPAPIQLNLFSSLLSTLDGRILSADDISRHSG
jgi:hypothetical protein